MADTVWIYAPVSNYPEEICGFKEGSTVGLEKFANFMWEHYPKYAPSDNEDLSTCRNDVIVLYENIDEFSKPFYYRKMGRELLDNYDPYYQQDIIFLSTRWSISSFKDFSLLIKKLTSHFHDPEAPSALSKMHFIEDNFYLYDTEKFPLIEINELIRKIDLSTRFQTKLRIKCQNFRRREKRQHVGGNVPLGFTRSTKGALLPDWDQQKFIRLIGYLRDVRKLTWPKVRDRLIELYSQRGRRYPYVTKARIPWSHPQCYKGYKAWKRIQDGEI